MNPSASSQSLGSQKPSTAASTASSKRTRTIIVARDLSEANASPPGLVSATPSSSQSRHPGSRQGLKPSKLSSYAALGNETDVELYQRFLHEKKATACKSPHGDTGATVDGMATLPSLKGSPKRRTDTQLDGPSGLIATASMTTMPPPPAMSIEDNTEAKQRRDAVVQHRKWLKSLPIHERLVYERQQNVIRKWKTINRQWETFKQRTSKKLGKSEKQLVMSRASEYREQIEMHDALQRAMPLSEKVGGDIWLVSLRNEGTRYVPVGNIFSGLYCPIRENSKLQPRVRRPLDYRNAASDDTHRDGDGEPAAHEKSVSTLEKRSLEALERKKRRLKKQLETLYPHDVEPSHGGHLKVDTADLFEWASSRRRGDTDAGLCTMRPHELGSSSRSLLLPLEEETREPDADMMNSHRSTARSRQSARRQGPSVFVFAADPSDENDTNSNDNTMQILELTFFTDIGVTQQHTLNLENNGTTAIHFEWQREDLVDHELASCLTQHRPRPLQEPTRLTWTSISQHQGMILPDEVLEFVFTFRSERAGVWLEQWVLHVDPPLMRHDTSGEPAAIVRLQSTALDNFVPISQRRQLQERITSAETEFMAEQVLKNDIIQRVDPVCAIKFPELSDDARAFFDAHRNGQFQNVQYSERFMTQARDLYASARTVMESPSSQEPVEVPVLESPRNPDAEAAVPPISLYPADWDASLGSLEDLVIAADAQLQTEYAALAATLRADRGDDDPDGEDDAEDDDDDEDNFMEKLVGTKARKREVEDATLRALEPHFADDFQSLTLAAHVSPYEPGLLNDTLAGKIADMASEAPVVHGIAEMTNTTSTADETCDMLSPLLVRALDEAFEIDRTRERTFEDAKRTFHRIALAQKLDFRELPQLLNLSALETPLQSIANPPIIFLQVDLDIANWFTLSPTPLNGALEWTLSPKLLNHGSYVPRQLALASTSVVRVLETALGRDVTIVLLSELSTPPMTKAMKKMEIAAAKASLATESNLDNATPPTPAEVEIARQALAHKRDRALSLRGVELLLKRAMAGCETPEFEFLGSLQALESACKAAVCSPTPGGDNTPTVEDVEMSSEAQLKPQQRVIVLEHLSSLTRQALKKPRQPSARPSPVTPSPVAPSAEKGKLDKKKPSVAPPAQTPKQASARLATTKEATPDEVDDSIEVAPGMSLEMMGAQALGRRLGQLGSILVADFFPQSWWEVAFVYFAITSTPSMVAGDGVASTEEPTPNEPKHILVGPRLLDTFRSWQMLFQPNMTGNDPPIKAVIGGRGLERKLRLIDGLLERVNAIYFVGELATTIFRVLHTKQLIKSIQKERKPVPRFESQRLIAAVERVIQKAYRKQVELLLPFDFVVGESRLERDTGDAGGNNNGGGDDDDDEEEEEATDEDEDDEDDDDDEDSARKKKNAKRNFATQERLPEPPQVDTWRPRRSYESDHGVVEANSRAWVHFSDVELTTLSGFKAGDGKDSLLEPAEVDETVGSTSSTVRAIPELDWTQRVVDIGPKSTQTLMDDLRTLRDSQSGWIFVNGTVGAVEFREFDTATQQLVSFLGSAPNNRESLLLTGTSTCRWFEQLGHIEVTRLASFTPVITTEVSKLATALAHVVESKQHAMLTGFDFAN